MAILRDTTGKQFSDFQFFWLSRVELSWVGCSELALLKRSVC